MNRKTTIFGGAAAITVVAVVIAVVIAGIALAASGPNGTLASATRAATAHPTPRDSEPVTPLQLTPTEIAALPEATYDAVIPGLLEAPADAHPTKSYQVDFTAVVYGSDRITPVARVSARNFMNEPTVVVPVKTDGAWYLILLPSRQSLPSRAAAGTKAAAQSAAWVATSALTSPHTLATRIVVSVGAQTLTITDAAGKPIQTFTVGVGTPDTPTPTGVTGYLQARYLDPAQGQRVHPIQLTSLHATGADEPYGGSDGGLIGIHYQDLSAGAVSHGCVRLDTAAIDAVDKLPLGTPITIVD
jgi:lipoprotein-anchoring transpeptidase ErfK/SrfK